MQTVNIVNGPRSASRIVLGCMRMNIQKNGE